MSGAATMQYSSLWACPASLPPLGSMLFPRLPNGGREAGHTRTSNLDRMSMNTFKRNSACYFWMQSEREQTLALVSYLFQP